MTQSTYFNQVKNVLKVLQGYTKGIRFIALLTMLCTIGVRQMWGAEATVYTSNVELSTTSGTKATASKAKISSVDYNAMKLGSSGNAGNFYVTIPANTTTLTLHAAAWNGKNSNTLTLSTETAGVTISPSTVQTLTANSGVSGNSTTYTITPDNTKEFFTYTITGATSGARIKLACSERCLIWGVNAETSGATPPTPSTTYTIKWHTAVGITTDDILNEGATITKPATDPAMTGYEFMGWTEDCAVASDGTGFTALTDFGTADSDKDFYAVFAKATTTGGGAATDIAIDLSKKDQITTNTTSSLVFTVGDVTFTNTKVNGSTNANNYCPGTTDKTYTSTRTYNGHQVTIASANTISKIVITAGTNAYATAIKNANWTNATASASNTTVTITPNAGVTSVSFKPSATAGMTKVVVTTGGGTTTYDNYITTCVTAPVVPIATVDPTSVTTTAAGAEGKVTVTYENVNTASVSVALFNDAACTETFTAGWLTAALDGDKNITYTVAENTTYTERKAYIKLTAPETNGAIDPDVVVIPVTQSGKDKVFASLEALLAAITPTSEGVEVTVTLTNEVIQDFYTSGSYRNGIALNVPYQGGVKVIEIYCQDVPAEWVKGGKVSGTITCPWKLYYSTWELCPAAWTELTYTAPPTVSSIAISGTPTKTTYVDGEEFDPAGLVVTATLTDDSTEPIDVALVDRTFNPETLSKGETSVSVVATYNTMASAAYEVTGLTVNDIPTKTVAEFIAAEGGRCYLEGIVSNITNTTYGNFDLTDASGTIYIYGCLNEAGESQQFAALGVKNGDKIKVIADEYELYGGTKDEAKNVQYVSHISTATISIADITIKVGETKNIEATITPDAAQSTVQYAITTGSEYITLNGTTITAVAAGTATITATIAEVAGEYYGATETFTVTVPTTYDVTWMVNGDEWPTTEVVEEGKRITTLPEEPTDECGGKTFVGWSNQEVTDGNKPAVLFTDAANSPIITDQTTFHAVFADKEGDGESGWQKVIATDEVVDGGIFALLTYDEAYYLANAQSTSDPLLQTVTKQDGKITVTDEMKWRATAVGGGFTFTSYNNPNYYLWGAHANDGIRINTESTKQSPTNVWSIELSNDYGVVLYHNASIDGNKYLSTYGDNNWRNYLISNINENNRVANLYKEYIGSTYSDYTTSCLDVNWTITEGGSLSTTSGITTTIIPNEGYTYGEPAYTVTSGSATVTQNGNIFIAVPTTDCTIQINMVQKTTYTVTWMVNGKEYTEGDPSTTVYAGESVATLPTPPEPNAYCGNIFVGWTTENPASGNFDEAPTVYNEQATFPTATGDQTFYAVFADYDQQ